jgi:hypothetical protein
MSELHSTKLRIRGNPIWIQGEKDDVGPTEDCLHNLIHRELCLPFVTVRDESDRKAIQAILDMPPVVCGQYSYAPFVNGQNRQLDIIKALLREKLEKP